MPCDASLDHVFDKVVVPSVEWGQHAHLRESDHSIIQRATAFAMAMKPA